VIQRNRQFNNCQELLKERYRVVGIVGARNIRNKIKLAMVKRFLNIFIITWMLCCCQWNSPSNFSQPLKSQLQDMLRSRIQDAGVHRHITVGSSELYSVKALLLTDAFLLYGSHLLSGRINPETIDPEWFANRRGSDLSMVLEHALTENRIEEILIELAPSQSGYATLRRALGHYRTITERGGWPRVPAGKTLQKGDRGPYRYPNPYPFIFSIGRYLSIPPESFSSGPIFTTEING
jgi:hypothetical protein